MSEEKLTDGGFTPPDFTMRDAIQFGMSVGPMKTLDQSTEAAMIAFMKIKFEAIAINATEEQLNILRELWASLTLPADQAGKSLEQVANEKYLATKEVIDVKAE